MKSAVAAVIVACVMGFAAQAGAVDLPPPPGTLTVLDFAHVPITVDGTPPDIGTAANVVAGVHHLAAASTTADVTVAPGCSVVAVAYRRDGPARAPTFMNASECPIPRAPHGDAIVRFACATAVESTPNGLDVVLRRDTLHAACGGFSARHALRAGNQIAVAIKTRGEVIRRREVDLLAGHAYTLAFGGAGEVPPDLVVIDEGAQPAQAPAPYHRIETGDRDVRDGGTLATWAFSTAVVAGIVCALVVRRRRAGLLAAVLVGVISLAGCGGSTSLTSSASTRTSVSGGSTERHLPTTVPTLTPVHAAPVRVELGDRTASVVPVSPDADLLELLVDPQIAWYEGSGVNGSGNLVLAGHSSWAGHRGILAALFDLSVGDTVTVTDARGVAYLYVVDGAVTRPKTDPWQAAWAPTANPGLVLVTCTGDRDAATQLHIDNYWVHASRTRSP